MSRLRAALPPPVARPWLAVAGSLWIFVSISGLAREPPVATGDFDGEVTVLVDARQGEFGPWSVGSTGVGTVFLDLPPGSTPLRGDVLTVRGDIEEGTGFAAGVGYGGFLEVVRIEAHRDSTFVVHVAGRWVRRHVLARLEPRDDGRALLAGFLVGETGGLDDIELEAMRRSGLTHFVAVSGSNVALFLAVLAVAAGPLGVGSVRRAVIGLSSLPVFVAATAFEPSVLRAATMAALVLAGRALGVVLEAWQLLALAMVGLVVAYPSLTSSLGFQLSVAATAGVLVGSRWPVEGRLQRSLAVTLGAQLAVTPILIAGFGEVPLASPLLNVLAAPIVAASTLSGMVGVVGLPPLVSVGSALATMVLRIAELGSALPQIGPIALMVSVAVGALVVGRRELRAGAALVASIGLVVAIVRAPVDLPPGSVAVLDVGQGDAILVNGGSGHHLLVDGGPDSVTLWRHLRSMGVDDLDVVVLTHVHSDHASGLVGLVDRLPIGEIWASVEPHRTSASNELLSTAELAGIPVREPTPGDTVKLGLLDIAVLGPLRRYASPNDQSIVLDIEGPRRSMLLTGDVEVVAQSELANLITDVVKVPHQGAATSDPDWLRGLGADLAVISVGPNDFGHPAPWVLDLFEEEGTIVRRTDVDGTVVVDLS